jgi:hypothetical protein
MCHQEPSRHFPSFPYSMGWHGAPHDYGMARLIIVIEPLNEYGPPDSDPRLKSFFYHIKNGNNYVHQNVHQNCKKGFIRIRPDSA